MKTHTIGFIGGGNMASSLLSGLIASGHSPSQLWVSDINEETLRSLSAELDVNISSSNEEIITQSDVVVFAVKPQVLGTVAQKAAVLIQQRQSLVVSIAICAKSSELGVICAVQSEKKMIRDLKFRT